MWSLFLINLQAFSPAFFFLKKTPTQLFQCEYCEMFKNSQIYRTPLVTVSEYIALLFLPFFHLCKIPANLI